MTDNTKFEWEKHSFGEEAMLDQKCAFCGKEALDIGHDYIIYDFVEGIPVKYEVPAFHCPDCNETYYRL